MLKDKKYPIFLYNILGIFIDREMNFIIKITTDIMGFLNFLAVRINKCLPNGKVYLDNKLRVFIQKSPIYYIGLLIRRQPSKNELKVPLIIVDESGIL